MHSKNIYLKEEAVPDPGSSPCYFRAGSPVSRILFSPAGPGNVCHLSKPGVADRFQQPTRSDYVFRHIHAGSVMRVNDFQETVCPDRNIFGLATHKVYPL